SSGERCDKRSIFGLAKFGPDAETAGTGQHHDERSLTAMLGFADKGLHYGGRESERTRRVVGSVEISPGGATSNAHAQARHERKASDRQRVRKARRHWAIRSIGQQVFVRQQIRRVAQEVHESFFIDARPMNPFEAAFTVEYEAALEPSRARGVTKEAAILVDIEHDVFRKDSQQRYWRLVLPIMQEANVGLVGAVHLYAVIGDTAAELARQLLDPTVGEGDSFAPDVRVAIGRGARVLGLGKIWIVLGAGSVARRCDGIVR